MNVQDLLSKEIDFSFYTLTTNTKGRFAVTPRSLEKEEGANLLITVNAIREIVFEKVKEFEKEDVFPQLRKLGDGIVETLGKGDPRIESEVAQKINEIVHHVLLSKWSHAHVTMKDLIKTTCSNDKHWESIFYESHFFKTSFFIMQNTLCIGEQFFRTHDDLNSMEKNKKRLETVERVLSEQKGVTSICLQNGFFTPCELPKDQPLVLDLLKKFLENRLTRSPFLLAKGTDSTCSTLLSPSLIEKSNLLKEMLERTEVAGPFEDNLSLSEINHEILQLVNEHASSHFQFLTLNAENLSKLLSAAAYLQIPELQEKCLHFVLVKQLRMQMGTEVQLCHQLLDRCFIKGDTFNFQLCDKEISQFLFDILDKNYPRVSEFLFQFLNETFRKEITKEEQEKRLKHFEEGLKTLKDLGFQLHSLEVNIPEQNRFLKENKFKDEHFIRILKACPHLKLLRLEGGFNLSPKVFRHLKSLTKLETIDFQFPFNYPDLPFFQADVLIQTLSALPLLQNLILQGYFKLSDAVAASLPQFTQLQFLVLKAQFPSWQLSGATFEKLTKMPRLKILSSNITYSESIGKHLKNLRNLEVLEIEGACGIRGHLQDLPHLKHVISKNLGSLLKEDPPCSFDIHLMRDGKELKTYCAEIISKQYPQFLESL